MAMAMGRLERVVAELEKLEKDADDILNTYVDQLMCREPPGTSWGVTKYNKILAPAGSTVNRVAALRMLREILAQI
jgi:hypothetical protein